MSRVLVTGGTGFVASHTIIQLLKAGHDVHTTVRRLEREADVKAMLRTGGIDRETERLSFFAADLGDDAGWPQAVAGCQYVLHVASPFPSAQPANEDALIRPARDGTLRVLRAARDANVERVVMTSSFGAIGYGHPARTLPFTEADWTDVSGADVSPYIKSKTLAERAAWEFAAQEDTPELAVINPVGIFGPALGPDYSSSIALIKSLLDGAMPATPRMYFGAVDVRDVADLHIRAMTSPEAKGQRFIAIGGKVISLHDAALVLRAQPGVAARKVPRWEFPDWLVRLLGHVSPQLRSMVPQLGIVRESTGEKARSLLGWSPRSPDDAVAASGESLIRLNLLGGSRR
jgi:dihydroflavonol-4-reductase